MTIRWTRHAVGDLISIHDYLGIHANWITAANVVESIYKNVERLERFPQLGRPGRRRGTREPVIGELPYLVFYRVKVDLVEILRILHGAQKIPS